MVNSKDNRNLRIVVALSVISWQLMGPPGAHSVSAQSKPLISSMSPTPMSVERTNDGATFVQDMWDAANQLKSYSFDYETIVFKGNKQIDQKGTFYFKQPRQIRVEMTGSYKRGAVAVLSRDGKVRGHLGGALSAFTMTISPDSDMLQGANGYPLVDSDFSGMSQVVKNFLKQGCKSQVTEHPVSVEGQPKKVYVLEVFRANSTELYKRAYIDPQSLLPLEWFDYANGKLYARTIWANFKNDATIADDIFKI